MELMLDRSHRLANYLSINWQSISNLLEGGSLCLTERGDVEPIERHPNFRVFACMNPPTDVGKKVFLCVCHILYLFSLFSHFYLSVESTSWYPQQVHRILYR